MDARIPIHRINTLFCRYSVGGGASNLKMRSGRRSQSRNGGWERRVHRTESAEVSAEWLR